MERGLKVKRFAFSTIEETLQSILEIGKLTGTLGQAQSLIDKMKKELMDLKSSSQGLPKKESALCGGLPAFDRSGRTELF